MNVLVQYLTRESTLEDDKGNTMKAMKVFSAVIKHLKEHLLKSCQRRDIGVPLDEIYWVLTVPAIWSDVAKQFMREAAEKVYQFLFCFWCHSKIVMLFSFNLWSNVSITAFKRRSVVLIYCISSNQPKMCVRYY